VSGSVRVVKRGEICDFGELKPGQWFEAPRGYVGQKLTNGWVLRTAGTGWHAFERLEKYDVQQVVPVEVEL